MVVSETLAGGPLRALLFLSDLDGGGAQRTLVNLANALPRNRILPTLVTPRTDGHARNWISSDTPLCDLKAGRLRRSLVPLRRLVQRHQPSALLATGADANVIAWLAVQGLNARPKLILRETNSHRARDDFGSIRRALFGLAYRRADAVVALSEGVRWEIAADYRLDSTHTHTLPNPVNVETIAATVNQARSVMSPIAKSGPLIVAIGRLTKQKGFDILLDAFAGIVAKDTRLAILGEGDERQQLELRAKELGVAGRVAFPGFVSNVAPWLAHADLFVLSSRWEGFGHVIVEAMASGLPVVATDCPYGPGEILRDGETGLLVQTENAQLLGEAMDRVLADSELGEKLGSCAAIDCQRFAVDAVAGEYATLIEETVSGGS